MSTLHDLTATSISSMFLVRLIAYFVFFQRRYINIFVETEEIGSFILYTSRIDNVGPSSVIANTHYYMLYTIYRSQGNFEM